MIFYESSKCKQEITVPSFGIKEKKYIKVFESGMNGYGIDHFFLLSNFVN